MRRYSEWTLRLFAIGALVTFGLIIVEHNFGLPALVKSLWRFLMLAMIMVPAVVLSSYVVIVVGLAIYALAKVVQTNWRIKA